MLELSIGRRMVIFAGTMVLRAPQTIFDQQLAAHHRVRHLALRPWR